MMMLEQWLTFTENEKNSLIMSYSFEAEITEEEAIFMQNNFELLDSFFKEAHKIAKVTSHCSVAFIVEYLRIFTTVNDKSQNEFKIANAQKAPLARISMVMFPALNGFFRTQKREIIK